MKGTINLDRTQKDQEKQDTKVWDYSLVLQHRPYINDDDDVVEVVCKLVMVTYSVLSDLFPPFIP